jgi:hypothetical protein
VGFSRCLFLPLTHQISSSILSDPHHVPVCRKLGSLRGVVAKRDETRLGIGLFEVPPPVRTPRQCDLIKSQQNGPLHYKYWPIAKTEAPHRFRLNFKSSTQCRGLAFCVGEPSTSEAVPLFGTRCDPPLEAPCLTTSISWHIHSQGPETRLETHESFAV